MLDPIKLTKKTQEIVCDGNKRKYYRFRAARFYGGIITADCVGCNLRCVFCWEWNVVCHPESNSYKFYSPKEVADKLINLAKKKNISGLRISGNEPTI